MKNAKNLQRLGKDLHRAIQEKNFKKIRSIFSKYPKLLAGNNKSVNVIKMLLLEATSTNDEQVVKELMQVLKSGGTNNSLDQNLCIALSEGNVKLAELLLKNGAGIKLEEESQISLYEKIFDRKTTRKSMIELLSAFNQIDPSVLNHRGENIMYTLFRFSRPEDQDTIDILKILLNAGVALEEVDNSNFICSIETNSYKAVEFFISLGCDVNQKYDQEDFEYPLHVAVFQGKEEIFELLLKNKANIKAKSSYGETVLHVACLAGNARMVKLLIQKRVEISAEDNEGLTPYSYIDTEGYNYEFTVKALIKEFAKMTFENVPVSQKDMKSVLENPTTREYFENSMMELKQMSSVKFYAHYTYYSVLNKHTSLKKLSKLVKNREFEENFKKYFSFNMYKYDLMHIFNKAVRIRDDAKIIESRLKSALGSYFPDIVMRKLENFFSVKDLPLE